MNLFLRDSQRGWLLLGLLVALLGSVNLTGCASSTGAGADSGSRADLVTASREKSALERPVSTDRFIIGET